MHIKKITRHFIISESGRKIEYFRVYGINEQRAVLPCRLTPEQRTMAVEV
jgi:hypothetical protein